MNTNPNDPAFTGPTDKGYTPGLTKREHIATVVLQGILANQYLVSLLDNEHGTPWLTQIESYSKAAIAITDHFISDLNKSIE